VDEQQEIDDYYRQLQGGMDNVPRRDIVLVIWDVNAKLGSDNTGRELVMGKEGLGVMNENGELFADFWAQNNLVIFFFFITYTTSPTAVMKLVVFFRSSKPSYNLI